MAINSKEETNMKFQLAVNLERLDDSLAMDDVARHTLEMVQMAEDGGLQHSLGCRTSCIGNDDCTQSFSDSYLVG